MASLTVSQHYKSIVCQPQSDGKPVKRVKLVDKVLSHTLNQKLCMQKNSPTKLYYY